jgi:hypothetical protein
MGGRHKDQLTCWTRVVTYAEEKVEEKGNAFRYALPTSVNILISPLYILVLRKRLFEQSKEAG